MECIILMCFLVGIVAVFNLILHLSNRTSFDDIINSKRTTTDAFAEIVDWISKH